MAIELLYGQNHKALEKSQISQGRGRCFGTGLRHSRFSSSRHQVLRAAAHLHPSVPSCSAVPLPPCLRSGDPGHPTCPRFCASSPPCCRLRPQLQQHPRDTAHPTTRVTGAWCGAAAVSCSTQRFGHNVPQPVCAFLCMQLPPALSPPLLG